MTSNKEETLAIYKEIQRIWQSDFAKSIHIIDELRRIVKKNKEKYKTKHSEYEKLDNENKTLSM